MLSVKSLNLEFNTWNWAAEKKNRQKKTKQKRVQLSLYYKSQPWKRAETHAATSMAPSSALLPAISNRDILHTTKTLNLKSTDQKFLEFDAF